MNNQGIEKSVSHPGHLLDIHSIFHTIQGEGPFSGTPAIFIRLAGCNLQCPECDTDYTIGRNLQSVGEVVTTCKQYALGGLVVITGGEPFRQYIARLVNRLLEEGYYVQVETNGTLPPPMSVVWSEKYWLRDGAYIVCSPKAGRMNSLTEKEACCLKYVLSHDSIHENDGLPLQVLRHGATPYVARPLTNKPIYVQPADSKDDATNFLNCRAAVESAMKHGYVVQLQLHKLLKVE